MENIAIIIIFIFGIIIGSFLNVVILRLPGQASLSGRSHCPKCKHLLHPGDLVPLFSYIALLGRCRYCKKTISPRYPLIELACAVLFVTAYLLISPVSAYDWLVFARAAFICATLLVVFIIDSEHLLILNAVVFPASVLLLVFNLLLDLSTKVALSQSFLLLGVLSAIGLASVFALVHYASRGLWMGLGDAKFAIFLGLATPYPNILVTVFLAFIIGAVVSVGLLLTGSKTMKSQIPFGTFLSAAAFVSLFWGAELLNWYLRLVGIN